jgi:hypothetical protein
MLAADHKDCRFCGIGWESDTVSFRAVARQASASSRCEAKCPDRSGETPACKVLQPTLSGRAQGAHAGALPSSPWKNTTVVRGTVPRDYRYNNIVIGSRRRQLNFGPKAQIKEDAINRVG